MYKYKDTHDKMICKHELIAALRSKFIPKYYTSNPTIHMMKGLLSLCNVSLLKNITLFISKLVGFENVQHEVILHVQI
jgi:hypothetical protein